ncbi:MAG TPA: XdhC family protein [Vicinamibacteria bacterium]|nr:XdhC family protein [Vicinamibacteria bacterium]
MRPDAPRPLLELAAELARRGEPFALATVVGRQAPISAQVGDMAVVTREGRLHGWVGGSCTRDTVIGEARKALEDGRPRFVALDPNPGSRERPGVSVYLMACHSGGKVEIHIQPVLPPPVVIVYGVSPTARAVARLAQAMGYAVHAVDPMADASGFPGAASIATEAEALRLARTSAPVFALVATQGQWDEDAVLAALAHEPAYLGVVASPKRFAEVRRTLAGKVPEASFSRIKNPAGLDLGARLPEEIALSILAEIVMLRRAPAPASREAVAPSTEEARDPVCGMSVRIEGARHHVEHQGRDVYFCCAGCRERFLASPEHYLAVSTEP